MLTDQPAIEVRVDGRSVLSCQPHPLFQQTGRIGLWADAPCGISAFTVRPVRRWTLCSRPRLVRPRPLGAIELPEYRRQEIALASTPGNDLTLYLLTPRPGAVVVSGALAGRAEYGPKIGRPVEAAP